jgi:hypothetical protein
MHAWPGTAKAIDQASSCDTYGLVDTYRARDATVVGPGSSRCRHRPNAQTQRARLCLSASLSGFKGRAQGLCLVSGLMNKHVIRHTRRGPTRRDGNRCRAVVTLGAQLAIPRAPVSSSSGYRGLSALGSIAMRILKFVFIKELINPAGVDTRAY